MILAENSLQTPLNLFEKAGFTLQKQYYSPSQSAAMF